MMDSLSVRSIRPVFWIATLLAAAVNVKLGPCNVNCERRGEFLNREILGRMRIFTGSEVNEGGREGTQGMRKGILHGGIREQRSHDRSAGVQISKLRHLQYHLGFRSELVPSRILSRNLSFEIAPSSRLAFTQETKVSDRMHETTWADFSRNSAEL